MKRFLLLLTIPVLFFPAYVYAEDGLWDNFSDINFYNNPEKQTAVSDEQFDNTVEKVKEKQKKKSIFIREPKKMKGESYQQSNETEFLSNMQKEIPILTVPCELLTKDGKTLPIGHYMVSCEKTSDGEVTMKFYQSHNLVAEYTACETEEDLFDEHINYLTLDDYEGNRVKINYGSMDFNAFAIIQKK